jgi:hypothetical protein
MIDMNKYKHKPDTLIGRLRLFIRNEVGSQPFTVAQLVRAVVDNDPVLAKRDIGSVRDGVNNVVSEMCAKGELEINSGDQRGRVYVLKQGGEQ